MSIILDALKRSDRERRLQSPPDLSQIYQENHTSRTSPLVWVLLAVVVLIAGISGAYWVFQKDSGTADIKHPETARIDVEKKKTATADSKALRSFTGNVSGKSAAPVSSRRKPKVKEEDQSGEIEPVKNDSEDSAGGNPFAAIIAKANQAKEEIAASGEGESEKGAHPLAGLFSKMGKPLKKTEVSETAVAPAAEGEKSAPPDTQVNAPVSSRDHTAILSTPRGATIVEPENAKVEVPEPVFEKQEQEKDSNPPSVSVPPETVKENAAGAAGAGKITLVEDLPYETRQKYEDLQINVHIYDEKPDERRVFINMRSYKEGEKIEEAGPLLVAIIPSGIIVDYGEGKIQMNVKK